MLPVTDLFVRGGTAVITLDTLRAFGADVDSGLARCMNNEAFYIRMVKLALSDPSGIEKLGAALAAKDVRSAFEAAHSLKGVYANLSLTPVFEPVSALTEIARAGSLDGTDELFGKFKEKYAELEALADE